MKKDGFSRWYLMACLCGLIFLFPSCTADDVEGDGPDAIEDPIVGRWSLVQIDETPVADFDCYRDSYIDADTQTISFFMQDLLENGECETVLDREQTLTVEDDFYFVDGEVIEIYVEGNELNWRTDTGRELIFRRS